jgi:membrane protease YdiL (CAAX protease family)
LSPLFQFVSPIAILIGSWQGARVGAKRESLRRGAPVSKREVLALELPPLAPSVILLIGFVAIAVAMEIVERHLGLTGDGAWRGRFSSLILAARILTIAVLAPVGEELLFRGVLFRAFAAKSVPLAIVLTSVLFAGFHIQYSWLEMSFVLISGLYYGFARAWSGSTLLTILMHMAGNSFAVYQRLH